MSAHELVAGALVDEPGPADACQVCDECGFACAKTEDGLCWACSHETGEAGA